MLRRMQPEEIKHGHLYAVTAGKDLPFTIEPYLCVETHIGKRFIHSMMLNLDTTVDGPHYITEETIDFAARHGWNLDPDDLWSHWSQREQAEQVLVSIAQNRLAEGAEHPIVLEAQRILLEHATPQGQASTWLRNSEHWPGSSVMTLSEANGELASAFVSITTNNPYKLRSLLRWLGVPKDIVLRVTGLDR